MRISKELAAIFLLLAVFVAIGLASGGQGEAKSRQVGKELGRDPSVTNDRASGSKAFYDWVGERGFHPQVWRRNWSALGQSKASVLVCVAPQSAQDQPTLFADNSADADTQQSSYLSAKDAPAIRRWLQSGHTLILLTSRLASGRIAGSKEGVDTFGDAMDLIVESTATHAGATEFAPRLPTRDTVDLMSIRVRSGMRIKRSAPDGLALFGDADGPVAESIPIGAGRLVVIADDAFAANENIAASDNAVFLDNLLHHHAVRGDIVLFDEYHHGDAALEAGLTLWGALGRPLQLFLLQMLGAALLLAIALGARFGTPIPLMRSVSRASSEYVESLSNLYRRAGASATALETIYRQFLRDVTGRLALPPDSNLEHLAATVARRGAIPLADVRQLLADCERGIDRGSVTESDLLTLVRRMDRIRKDIGIV